MDKNIEELFGLSELYESSLFLDDEYSIMLTESKMTKLLSTNKELSKKVSKTESEFEKNKKKVKDIGIIDIDKLTGDIKANSRAIKRDIKNGKSKSEVIKNIIGEYFDISNYDDFIENSESVVILSIVIAIQATIVTIMMLMLPGVVVTIINAIVIAPITEEIGSYLSVKGDTSESYELLFNVIRFATHLTSDSGMPNFITGGLFSVLMHYTNSAIKKYYDREEDNLEKGTAISIAINATYNTLSIFAVK